MQTFKTLSMPGIAACLAFGVAMADEPASSAKPGVSAVSLNIKAQPLGDALTAFAAQTGLQVVYYSKVEEGLHAPALNGQFSLQEALRQLLTNTSLDYKFLNPRTVAIRVRKAEVSGESLDAAHQMRVAHNGDRAVPIDKTNLSPVEGKDLGENGETDTSGSPSKEDQAQGQEMVVTGTSLRGGVAPESSPVIVYTREDIEASGQTTVEQFMRNVPQNFNGGVSQENYNVVGSGTTTNTQGAGVNLRGLGQAATLVLLNGRRLAPSGSRGDFVDVSLIPLSAVQRIEILTNGASAIYGSDAVGGVVNYILREDFDGFETALQAGSATKGDGDQLQVAQTFGKRWGSGHGLLSYEYRSEDSVRAGDRDFVINIPPASLFSPEDRRHSVLASLGQQITDRLSFDLVASYLQRDTRRDYLSSTTLVLTRADADSNSRNFAAGLTYDLTAHWRLDFTSSYSQNWAQSTHVSPSSANDSRTKNKVINPGLKIAGSLFSLPGGSVEFAAGAQVRMERYDDYFVTANNSGFFSASAGRARRNIRAVFSEAQIPIVSALNRRPGIERLEINAAGRYEDYGSIGTTLDPKVGVLWSPREGVSLRATYDTSFRAPLLAETLGVYSAQFRIPTVMFANPAQATGVPLALIGYGTDIQPENSTTWTAGLDLRPPSLPELRVTLNYFSTDYSDRIAQPSANLNLIGNPAFESIVIRNPSPAFTQGLLNGAVQVIDRGGPGQTPAGLTAADVTVILDRRIDNTAVTRTAGFDVGADYQFAVGTHEFFATSNATRILTFENQLTTLSPFVETLNTPFNPIEWRLRSGLGWAHRGWSGNLFLNYIDRYFDSRYIPARAVDSFRTFDLTLGYNFEGRAAGALLSGTRIAFSALNLFDTDPPTLLPPPGIASDVGYDSVNASGRGRFISLQLRKVW